MLYDFAFGHGSFYLWPTTSQRERSERTDVLSVVVDVLCAAAHIAHPTQLNLLLARGQSAASLKPSCV